MDNQKKAKIGWAIKIVCILLMVVFFIPMFAVSCGEQEINVSPAHSVVGFKQNNVSYYGPSVWCVLMFIIPLLIFLAWLCLPEKIKKTIGFYIGSISSTIVHFILLSIFNSKVNEVAQSYYAVVRIKPGFVITLCLLTALIVLICLSGFFEIKDIMKPVETKKNTEDSKQEDVKP